MGNGQKEKEIREMMKHPAPGKKVGIVHLHMVREERGLYGMRRFTSPREIAGMVRPLLMMSDREMMVVLSLSAKMEPLALEIAAVGGVDSCCVDIKSIFKHALLSNAVNIVCVHNHPSGDPYPSREDYQITRRIRKAGRLLGISLADHIIIGGGAYYSFQEQGILTPPNLRTVEGRKKGGRKNGDV